MGHTGLWAREIATANFGEHLKVEVRRIVLLGTPVARGPWVRLLLRALLLAHHHNRAVGMAHNRLRDAAQQSSSDPS